MPQGDARQQTPVAPRSRRVLLLTSEDLADANEVPGPIRELIEDAEEIRVLAPTLTTWLQWLASDIDAARVIADERLHRVFDHMHADGISPEGMVADEDQVVAIADALFEFDADLIVLRLHHPGSGHESWHERRVAERVRSHFDLPTIAFYFDDEGQVVGREDA
jgi:nucleotide-binding universal stress UspA family protein